MNNLTKNRTDFILILLCFTALITSFVLLIPQITKATINFTGSILFNKTLSYEHWVPIFQLFTGCIFAFSLISITLLIIKNSIKSNNLNCLFNRNNTIVAIALAALCFFLNYLVLNREHFWGDDFSEYLLQAIAFANGTYESYKANPMFIGYPCGYPILLVPFYKLFGLDLFALKFLNVLMYSATMAILYILFSRRFSTTTSCIAVLFLILSPQMLDMSNSIGSDASCLFFSMVTLLIIDVLFKEKTKHDYLKAIAVGFCIFAAQLCREQGLLLLCTILFINFVALLKKKNPKKKIFNTLQINEKQCNNTFLYIISSYLIFYIISNFFIPSRPRTDIIITARISDIMCLFKFYAGIFKDFFNASPFFFDEKFINNSSLIPWIICIPFIVIGFIKCFTKEFILNVYLCGTLAFFCIWSGPQGLRYVYSLLPILIILFIEGTQSIKQILNQNRFEHTTKYVISAFIIACLAFFISADFIMIRRNLKDDRSWYKTNYSAYSSDAQDMYEYINKNTAKNCTIKFTMSRALYLFTNRIGDNHAHNADISQFDYYLHFLYPPSYYGQYFNYDDVVDAEIIETPTATLFLEYANDKFRFYKVKAKLSLQN